MYGKTPDTPQTPPRARTPIPTERLGRPNFDLLHEQTPVVVGLRPQRDGGARIEVTRTIDTPTGPKTIIHNYGHGGAGMTLSFGSAEMVCDRMAKHDAFHTENGQHPTIAILGSGVIGLTTAHAIKRRWPNAPLTIYARQCDVTKTTSYAAGGQFAPLSSLGEYASAPQQTLLNTLLDRSRDRLQAYVGGRDAARYGIAQVQSYSLDTSPAAANVRLDFGATTLMARRYGSWLMDPTRLLPALRADLIARQVPVIERDFARLHDVYALSERFVINCTGFGARDLFGDTTLVARRGHLVVLHNPDKLRYFLNSWCGDASSRYLFARFDDIVIGGTIQRDNESETYDAANPDDAAARDRIFRRARALLDKSANACA
jgi:D-amino-acid oxidase